MEADTTEFHDGFTTYFDHQSESWAYDLGGNDWDCIKVGFASRELAKQAAQAAELAKK